MKSFSLGLSVVLEDSDFVQLKNYFSRIMLISQNQKGPRIDSKMEGRWIKHYSSCHKILLVGEGDFSFALSLARVFCSASNMVATSLDSQGTFLNLFFRVIFYLCAVLWSFSGLCPSNIIF
jgi:hypothetical protein